MKDKDAIEFIEKHPNAKVMFDGCTIKLEFDDGYWITFQPDEEWGMPTLSIEDSIEVEDRRIRIEREREAFVNQTKYKEIMKQRILSKFEGEEREEIKKILK